MTKEAAGLVERKQSLCDQWDRITQYDPNVPFGTQGAGDDLCRWSHEAAALITEQGEEISRCHARLEIEYYFDDKGSPVPISMEERSTAIDGIEARDCTIKLQDENIERLRERAERAEARMTKLTEAWNNMEGRWERSNLSKAQAEIALLRETCASHEGEIARLRLIMTLNTTSM